MTDLRKLNVGCGPVQPEGWVNDDIDPQWGAVSTVPIGGFDIMVANHVIQQVEHARVVQTLDWWRMILVRGGCLRLLVPDVAGAFSAWRYGVDRWFPCEGATIDEKFCAYLSQAGTTKSFYTRDRLVQVVVEAGFHGWQFCEPGETSCRHEEIVELDSRPRESLIIEAYA